MSARALAPLGLVMLGGSVALLAALGCGCATVSQNRRAHLADPMMNLGEDPLDAARHQKLYCQ
jgi:hypothetical protein